MEAPLTERARARVFLPFALVTLIWGSTWLVIRDQLGLVPSGWSVTYRFLVASVAMFVYASVRRQPLLPDRRAWPAIIAIGLTQFVINFNLVYQAEVYVTSGLVAVVFALLLVPNAIFAWIFLKQGLSRPFLLGSAVAIGGVALLFAHEMHGAAMGAGAVARGIGFTLVAVLAASSANVMQASARLRAVAMPTLVAWCMGVGVIGDGSWAFAQSGPPVFDWRLGYVAGLLYLGLAASALAFTLYYAIIREIGAARAAHSSVLVPVIAMTLSTIFEHYHWSLTAAAGGILAMAGLLLALGTRKT